MIQTGFETRIKVQDIVSSQLPNFILDESPKTVDFLKQYYISQENQGGPIDLSANLDQYLDLSNLTPEVVVDNTITSADVTSSDSTINVSSTKGFPKEYGLLKIDNEIISYTGITTNSFTGCIRGFSGISSYRTDSDNEEIIFLKTSAKSHDSDSNVQNLSSLFLKEFYKKFKTTFSPGLENNDFVSSLNVGNFIREIKSFYQSKGSDESFRILFEVLYGETPSVINLEEKLIKPSFAEYRRREVAIAKVISGDATALKGQGLFKENSNIVASISEISAFKIDSEIFYKVFLFVGYDEDSDIQGRFLPTPNSKCTEDVGVNQSVINVDSTIGFGATGTFRSGSNTISYTDKTVNQFLNCTGVTNSISQGDLVFDNQTYYGYENGDINKKVELVFFTTLNNIKQKGTVSVIENDPIGVKNLGDKVINPLQNKSSKQILANSWIYNTNSSYFINNYDTNTLELFSPVDKSSLKLGDFVEVVERDTGKVIFPDDSNTPFVSIDGQEIQGETSVTLDGGFNQTKLNNDLDYNLRKILNKSNIGSQSNVSFKYGNESLISDIQNVYFDDEYAYVASNSLPSAKTRKGTTGFPLSEDINVKIKKIVLDLDNQTGGILTSFNELTGKFSAIEVKDNLGKSVFKTGDKIFYQPQGDVLVGLETGNYFVEVIDGAGSNDQIKLYGSNYLIGTENNLTLSGIGTHTITLDSQKSGVIGPQKLLKKFPINQQLVDGKKEETIPGGIGLLINGVEITNYKSTDKVYYGPLKKINVLNGGENFDVINPPKISIESGLGSTALAQPVVSGSITDVIVDFDTYNFNINKVISIGVTGGNGTGCILQPSISKTFREVQFDSRISSAGGGINTITNQIVFDVPHGFVSGQEVIYDSNLGSEVGITSIKNGNTRLINKSTYVVDVTNNVSIKLHENFDDFTVGINTIQFTGETGSGIQKIKVGPLNVLKDIVVIDGGKGYTNKKLIVTSSGISTNYNWIQFENHGFNDGEKIEYSIASGDGTSSPQIISGLSTSKQYQILKVDDDKFRLCDAGIGGTITNNFNRKNYVKFNASPGTGYQQFSYPPIVVDFRFATIGTEETSITLTPIVKGSITSVDLYDSGTGYGSSIVNYQNTPNISIQNGKDARVLPIVSNGRITAVNVEYGGQDYYSVPDLIVEDSSKSGSGAVLRPVIKNNKLDSVKVIKSGIGYSSTDTSVSVISSGINHVLDSEIRDLTIVTNEIFESNKLLIDNDDNELKYSVCGYDVNLFSDSNSSISGIIGWAYDGNPIYGPYGSKDPNEFTTASTLVSGYTKSAASVINRPSTNDFVEGFFVEDYQYDGTNADLDEHNGRYEKNRDFPNGVYAYHAVVDIESRGNAPLFPFFIGNTFRSKKISENFQFDFNQSYDFNNSTLQRNTFPYNVNELFADNFFIKIKKDQKINVDRITSGNIKNTSIVSSGDDFKVNDIVKFDSSETDGSGLNVKVSSIKGEEIIRIDTVGVSTSSVLTWGGDNIKVSLIDEHDFKNGDYIALSGISTESLKALEKYHRITVQDNSSSRSISTISAGAATTEIYVSFIPSYVSSGSTIGIGTEQLTVLNVFGSSNILRVERGSSSVSYPENTLVNYTTKSFTIDGEFPYFTSKNNNEVRFNAAESVGIGTNIGSGFSTSFTFGQSTVSREIPIRGIHLENHPFKTNQPIELTNPQLAKLIVYSSGVDGPQVSLTNGTYYAVNKSKNVIGIKTTLNSEEIYFRGFSAEGDTGNNDRYLFKSKFDQVTSDVKSIKTTVSVSTSHNLSKDDLVQLNIVPNISVGIGTTASSVSVKIDDDTKQILVNPVGFNSLGISTTTNQISLINHSFNTGDKVRYTSSKVASGLNTGGYFVLKVDGNTIKLGETYSDVISVNPKIVSIAGTGGTSHTLSLINPEIKVTKNNNLTFDLSDSTLGGYEFKIYHDNTFKNEFVSTGDTSSFTVLNSGINGTTGAALTIYSDNNSPISLYYNIEKSGYISTSDKDVKNYSAIIFEDSKYNKEFKVASGVGVTTFDLFLEDNPEKFSYLPSECEILEYSTTSKNAKGGINSLNIISSGSGYKKFPSFVGSSSTIAEDAIITLSSDTVGNISNVDIITDEFKYYTDNTLRPTALLPSVLEVKNSNSIRSIVVEDPGEGYFVAPSLVIVDKVTGEKLDTGFLEAEFSESIVNVNILEDPKGLPDSGVVIKSVFNTNGFTIDEIESTVGTAITCTLVTPSLGFSTSPFKVGDEIYVEGILKSGSDGTGHNSEDYGYRFFKIKAIPDDSGFANPNPSPFKVEFDVVGLTTNTGIAVTLSNGLGKVIPKDQYPSFKVVLDSAPFTPGEKLNINNIEKDLEVVRSTDGELVVFGSDSETLKIGDKISGRGSLTIAEINKIKENKGVFSVDFSYKTNTGWENSTGKLSIDHQVIADNDYHQNLSYSVKSNQTWKEIKSPVGRLVHTSGLKNFSDTQIPSDVKTSIGSSEQTISISDTINETRVDILRGIDLARDDESDGEVSSFVQFNKTRFVNFVDCRTNNVIPIDNINQQFSNLESSPDRFLNLDIVGTSEKFDNYLVRIESFEHSEKQLQLSEFVLLSNGVNHTLFNKSELVNSGEPFTTFAEDKFGDYAIETNTEEGISYLRFVPNDPNNIDYDLKFIKTSTDSGIGIGTQSLGFIDLVSSNKTITTGITTTLFSKNLDKIESAYIVTKVINSSTKEMNFVETYVTHDGTDTYISEYYVDAGGESLNNRIGLSTASISDNQLVLSYENDTSDDIKIRSKIVGFGTTALGNGEYRYLVPGQNSGDERTAKYESSFIVGVGTTAIFSGYPLTFDAVKCNVEVSVGSSKALHQITAMHDGTNAYLQQSQFLANNYNSISGLGTFSATHTTSNFIVNFHPEDTTGITTIKTFNQVFYKDIDQNNDPDDLIYGNIVESAEFKFYNAINGDRINRKQFDLKNNGTDIFKKSFNPSITIVASSVDTGIAYSSFSVKNHFFRTGEELIYTPKSTFVGVGSTPMQYTIDGSIIETLPSKVFAIRHDDNEFGIATTKAHANSGIGVTITSFGEGNAHTLEMVKSNEKALMAIDGIVQTPISNTNITHTVNNNPVSGISTVQTTFALSGISSMSVINILKVDDEYMRVENVGIGTSSIGPITPGIGTFNLVTVERGAVGSSATAHANGSLVELYKGNYNIVDSKVNFIEAPRGNPQGQDRNGLPFSRSIFNGRVYLRNDYTTNFIYDDISNQFTGITSEFTLTVGGANTTGIGTSGGQGVLFINGIFQTPETDNNPQQNYQILETFNASVTLSSNYALNVGMGITQFNNPGLSAEVISGTSSGIATFFVRSGSLNVGIGSTLFADGVDTGVRPTNVSIADTITTLKFTGMYVNDVEQDYVDESDVNTNQIPRGGLPISVGSTAGLGYAPLIGAKLRPVVVGGVITDVVGVATTGTSFGISTATYDKVTGILSVTTDANHGLVFGNQNKDEVRLVGLEFTCPGGSGITTTIYPENGARNYQIVGVSSEQTFQVNVGTSTITHDYVGSGSVTQFFGDLSFGSGYNGIVSVSVAVTETGHSGTAAVITGSPVGFNTHRFVSATAGIVKSGSPAIQPESGTTYNPQTGILSVTAASHGLSTNDLVTIANGSLVFSCAQDSFQTLHAYPRITDYISGVSTAITKVNNDKFTVFVGTSPAHGGGALEFTISNGGTGYSDPEIFVSEPSYENLSVIGISRRSVGLTTETGIGLKVDVIPTPSSDYTGIGSELFEVSKFEVSTPGYGFLPGDKFKAVGLVTSRFIDSLIKEFEMEITNSFTDAFSLWQFGEFDYLDPITSLQDGKRTRFPLKYENELISVEANDSFDVELDPILLIFRNRVIQEPGKTYEFVGGTTVNFKVAPRPEDDIHMFFYKGTDGEDSSVVIAPPKPIEIGDEIKIISNPNQDDRLVSEFTQSDTIRTNTYRGFGITDDFKPIEVKRQKDDLIIDGELVSKSRVLLEPRINPTAKIISDFSTTDSQFFIDTPGQLFNYEQESSPQYNIRINSEGSNPVSSAITATVSAAGTISNLTIVNGGSKYASAPTVHIQAPPAEIGVGIGTTATATLTINNGSVNGFTITNPGFGYSQTNPPQVIVSLPDTLNRELITGITSIKGNKGVITGIGTTTVNGNLGIKFTAVCKSDFDSTVFTSGNPVYIYDTEIGDGVTSINGSDSEIVGIGTTCADNIYIIKEFTSSGAAANLFVGIITCRILSTTDTTKIPETVGFTTDPIGKFSVGLIVGAGIQRSSEPLSIGVTGFTINSGLTTFPTVQRFGGDQTLFGTGSIIDVLT